MPRHPRHVAHGSMCSKDPRNSVGRQRRQSLLRFFRGLLQGSVHPFFAQCLLKPCLRVCVIFLVGVARDVVELGRQGLLKVLRCQRVATQVRREVDERCSITLGQHEAVQQCLHDHGHELWPLLHGQLLNARSLPVSIEEVCVSAEGFTMQHALEGGKLTILSGRLRNAIFDFLKMRLSFKESSFVLEKHRRPK